MEMKQLEDVRVYLPSEGRTKHANNEKDAVVSTPAGKEGGFEGKTFPRALCEAKGSYGGEVRWQ